MERGIIKTPSRSFLQVKSLISSGSITIKPSGDVDDYFTFATVSDIPTIYGTGAYLRIGDAATTSHSLAAQDDLMVSGVLEVGGAAYFDGAVTCSGSPEVAGLYVTTGNQIRTGNVDGQYFKISARDNGVGIVELMRVVSADDPYIHIGLGSSGTTVYGVGIRTVSVTCDHATHAMFNAAATTDNALVWQQPAASVLLGIRMVLSEQFAAASLTDLDITLGQSGGDEDGWLVQTMNLTSDAVNTQYKTRGALWDTSAEGVFSYAHAATDIYGFATAVGANLNTLSAGTVVFYFTYLDLP